jgi:predicted PurR-regulated permease PerM
MFEEKNLKNLITMVLILALFVAAAFIIRPIFMSIIVGLLLGYVFYPIYQFTKSKIKHETTSAFLISLGFFLLLMFFIIVIIRSLAYQAISAWTSIQSFDPSVLVNNLPIDLIMPKQYTEVLSNSFKTFVSSLIAGSLTDFSNIISNLPVFLLQLFVVFFVFFFALRDGESALDYISSVSPLEKNIQERFFQKFKDVTYSVIVGQILVGIIQGVCAGVGYFIFGVPNALLLTLLTIITSIIPFIGSWLVWIPVVIYLLGIGKIGAGIGLFLYGAFFVSIIDNILRPVLVSQRLKMNSGIVLVGMVGGLLSIGTLGILIGPLVLAYVLLVLELYKQKKSPDGGVFKVEEGVSS